MSIPESESLPVKLTVTSELFQPLLLATGDGEPEALGLVLSIFTVGEVNVLLFPALSVTVTVPVTALPSEVRTNGLAAGFVVSTPERASDAVNPNETFVLFHPFPFAAGDCGSKPSVGSVLSMLMFDTKAVSELPAASIQVALTAWLTPSVTTVTWNGLEGDVPVAPLVMLIEPIPLASVQVKLTSTLSLFHPFEFAGVTRVPENVGAVVSIVQV